jgi:hypothetical protein
MPAGQGDKEQTFNVQNKEQRTNSNPQPQPKQNRHYVLRITPPASTKPALPAYSLLITYYTASVPDF